MGTSLLLVLLIALTGTGVAIFDMASKRTKELKSRYRFTATSSEVEDQIVFEIWTNDYSEALQHAYDVKSTYEANYEWQTIEELDLVTGDVIGTVYQKVEVEETVSEKV